MARSPGRDGCPLSLAPLTPEDALKRAVKVPAPEYDPKPAKLAAKKAKRKKG
jgi:hypothetical protein